jgi:hypothetical protein
MFEPGEYVMPTDNSIVGRPSVRYSQVQFRSQWEGAVDWRLLVESCNHLITRSFQLSRSTLLLDHLKPNYLPFAHREALNQLSDDTMESSFPSKKRRLISDYFAPAPAPIHFTTSFVHTDDTDSEWNTDNLNNQEESPLLRIS